METTVEAPARRTLLDLTTEAALLLERIDSAFEETGGEATDEVLALLDEDLANREQLVEKLRNYCWVMKEKEAEAKRLLSDASIYEEIAANIRARAERAQKAYDAMHDRVHFALGKLGVKEIEADPFVLKVRGKGGSRPVILKETDPNRLPTKFQRRTVTIKFIVGKIGALDLSELEMWLEENTPHISLSDSIDPDKAGLAQALKDGDRDARRVAELGEVGTKLVIQ